MTQVDHFWELVAKLTSEFKPSIHLVAVLEITVDDWERMDRDQDFVSLAVDADGVVVVLVGLVACGRELHVDVL